jgi:hypothetical protein
VQNAERQGSNSEIRGTFLSYYNREETREKLFGFAVLVLCQKILALLSLVSTVGSPYLQGKREFAESWIFTKKT